MQKFKKILLPITYHLSPRLGFTLIELLVVISIIGILASLAMVSYSGAQKQTRDTQRKSDLAQYRNGLESYAATNNGLYPNYASATQVTTVCSAELSAFISDCTLDDPFKTATPARHYYYQSSTTKYILYADLETAGWWYICSTGQVNKTTNETNPTLATCP